MAPYRSGSGGGVRSNLELAGQQPLHAFVALDDQDKIHALDADLQTPTPACNRKECRRAPFMASPASSNASAVLRAKHKSTLEQVRHYGHALCVLQYFFWNAPIRCRNNLIQHGAGMFKTISSCLASCFSPNTACHTQ